MRPLTALLLTVVLTVAPLNPAAAGAGRCASTLDCSAAELEAIPLPERLALLQALQDRVAAEYIPGFRHWSSLEGLLRFFIENGYGTPGSWVSHVDAGDLEAIERGVAIALGVSEDDFGNPGSRRWADYLQRMRRGELTERWVHDPAWGEAEDAAIHHGVALAEANGVRPDRLEWSIYQFSELYRWFLRNPQPALLVLDEQLRGTAGVPLVPVDFLNWLTDVTTEVPVHRGAHVAHDLSLPDPVGAPVSIARLLLAYTPELARVHREETAALPR